MPFVSRKGLLAVAGLGVAAAAVVAGAVWSGVYNVAADDPHTGPVHAALETLRERSIEVRAADLAPPDLADPARIRQGAGNYAAMCAGCHGAPGQGETELQRGLYPRPPDLTRERVEPRAAFWVVKHGIKASGMPAWGRSMDDEYVWNLVAFTGELPTLDAAQYATLVASSEGHSHGGGESHAHDGATAPPHEDAPAAAEPAPSGDVHVHADGSKHLHEAAPAPAPAPKAEPTLEAAPAAADPPPEEHDHDHEHDHP
jgi:mono/diheme cytochrome c family protein